jgi:hypothetical protein
MHNRVLKCGSVEKWWVWLVRGEVERDYFAERAKGEGAEDSRGRE